MINRVAAAKPLQSFHRLISHNPSKLVGKLQ